jgi:hypothetical protein
MHIPERARKMFFSGSFYKPFSPESSAAGSSFDKAMEHA